MLLNEKLTTELRPTLFLAQLSNLLAGNISIVHKVTGSSRTFMGEEGAGVSAVETAAARIRSGQSTHVLVGGAFQTEHPDMLLGYELGGYLHRGPLAAGLAARRAPTAAASSAARARPSWCWNRASTRERAARTIYAELGAVVSGRARRNGDDLDGRDRRMLAEAGAADGELLVISGASGAHHGDRGRKGSARRQVRRSPRAAFAR